MEVEMEDSLTTTVQAGKVDLPAYLYDGYALHQSLLARGLRVLLLPRQVLLAGVKEAVPAELSFSHGVPQSSTLSGVTFALDRRLRRALLERVRVSKLPGATFSYRSLSRATKWAEAQGFPVRVREVAGENPGKVIRGINSVEELRTAFDELRIRNAEDRAPGSNPLISGYTTTHLAYVHDEEGNQVAPARTRLLLEKEVEGQAIRAFVIEGKIVSAIELGPDGETGVSDYLGKLKPSQADTLVRAARAIPGLGCATIDAVVRPNRLFRAGSVLITEVSERPRMLEFLRVNPALEDRIRSTLLTVEAKRQGISLGEEQQSVTRRLVVEGLRNPAIVGKELPRVMESYGLKAELTSVDEVGGRVELACNGDPSTLAALTELLMSGDLIDDRASAIEYLEGTK